MTKSTTRPTVGVHEAKTHLSRLIEDAGRGVETVIERRGVPVALIVPYPGRTPVFGTGGPVVVHDGFDDLPPDLAEALGA